MKKTRIFILLILGLLLTNCNEEEKRFEKNQTKVETPINENIGNTKFKFSEETYKNLEEFSKNKKEVIKKLKTSTKEEADKLYNEYYKENKKFCETLMQTETFFYDYIDFDVSDTKEKFQEAKKLLMNMV